MIKKKCRRYRRYFYVFLPLLLPLIVAMTLLSQPRWLLTLAEQMYPGVVYAFDLPTLPNQAKTVALTIDDGPSSVSAEILAVLKRHHAKATFFNISDRLPGREAVIRQAVSAGHELGNHLTTDEPSIRLTPLEFEAALLAADRAFSPYLAHQNDGENDRLHWLRPGMGWYSQKMVDIASQHGYQIALGSVFPYDTHVPFSRFASAFILSTVRSGDVVVLHDGEAGRGQRTVQTLITVLPILQTKGYTITTLSDLSNLANLAKLAQSQEQSLVGELRPWQQGRWSLQIEN